MKIVKTQEFEFSAMRPPARDLCAFDGHLNLYLRNIKEIMML